MAYKKNIYRLVFLILGFVFTLLYFTKPAPRVKTPTPTRFVALAAGTSEQSSQAVVVEQPVTDQEIDIQFFNHGIENDAELKQLEANILAQIDNSYLLAGSKSGTTSTLPELNSQNSIIEQAELADLELNSEDVRASAKIDSLLADEQNRLVVMHNDQAEEPELAVIRIEEVPINTSQNTENNKEVSSPKLAAVIKEKHKVARVKLEKIADHSTKQASADHKSIVDQVAEENIKLREQILTMQILLDQVQHKAITKDVTEAAKTTKVNTANKRAKPVLALAKKCKPKLSEPQTNINIAKGNKLPELNKIMLTTERAGLRAGPGMNYSLLTVLPRGQNVAINYWQGKWVNISTTTGLNAWLLRDHLMNG